jgi:hypothetical protein
VPCVRLAAGGADGGAGARIRRTIGAMHRRNPECLDSDPSGLSIPADILLREEPEDEEEHGGGGLK